MVRSTAGWEINSIGRSRLWIAYTDFCRRHSSLQTGQTGTEEIITRIISPLLVVTVATALYDCQPGVGVEAAEQPCRGAAVPRRQLGRVVVEGGSEPAQPALRDAPAEQAGRERGEEVVGGGIATRRLKPVITQIPEAMLVISTWPKTVTRSGSPPNCLMLSRTQARAASWSS